MGRRPRLLHAAVIVAVLALSVAACSSGGGQSGATSTTRASAPSPGSSPTSSTPGTTAGSTTTQTGGSSGSAPAGPVDAQQAGQVAVEAYGGTVKEVESDHYRGTAAWEVELRNSNQGRIEVKVAKATGEVLNVEHEDD